MRKNKKLYELKIDPENDAIVDFISLVDEPAIEIDFIAFSKQDNLTKELFNDEKMELMGVVLVPNMKINRVSEKLGEYDVFFSEKTIRDIAQLFFKNGFQNNMNLDHSILPAHSTIYQSFIVDRKRGINPPNGLKAPDGSWIVGVKVYNKDVWSSIKQGKRKGFSIEGVFQYFESLSKNTDVFNSVNDLKGGITNEMKALQKIRNSKMNNSYLKNLFIKSGMKIALDGIVDEIDDDSKIIVVSQDDVIISNQSIGSKFELKGEDGEPVEPVDGQPYQIEETGLIFVMKGGVIESITDKDGNPYEEKSSDEELEDAPDVVSKDEFESFKSEIDARLKAIEDSIKTTESVEVAATKQEVEALSKNLKEFVELVRKQPVETKIVKSNFKQDVENEREQKRIQLAKILANRKKGN